MLELLKSYAQDQVSRGQTGLPSGNVLIGQSTPTPVFALDVGHGDWEIKWHIPGYLSHESVTVLGKQMKDWLGGGVGKRVLKTAILDGLSFARQSSIFKSLSIVRTVSCNQSVNILCGKGHKLRLGLLMCLSCSSWCVCACV